MVTENGNQLLETATVKSPFPGNSHSGQALTCPGTQMSSNELEESDED